MELPWGTGIVGELPEMVSTWIIKEGSITYPSWGKHRFFIAVIKTF